MFFYYWIPVKKHIDFENQDIILTNSITKGIADISKNIVDITVEINPSSLDINISLLTDSTLKEFTLIKKKHNVNGFLVYECISIQPEDNQDIELLSIQAYHCVKEFFHVHEYHDAGNDALIKAFLSNTADEKEKYLEHYYKLYTDKFDEYKNLIDLFTPTEILKEFKSSADIEKASIRIKAAKRLISLARGEMIYADFLLSACIHEDLDKIYKEYKAHFEMYEKELTIYYDNYDSTYEPIDMIYSKQINRYQIYLGVLGITIGVVSFIFS